MKNYLDNNYHAYEMVMNNRDIYNEPISDFGFFSGISLFIKCYCPIYWVIALGKALSTPYDENKMPKSSEVISFTVSAILATIAIIISFIITEYEPNVLFTMIMMGVGIGTGLFITKNFLFLLDISKIL